MKRIFSLLLSLAIIAGIIPFASATSVSDDIHDHVAEAVALETENPLSPLYEYSINELSLGDAILVYSYVNNSIQESQANYIPVFIGNTLLAMAFVSPSSSNKYNVEITTELVQELTPYINCNISLIFDATDTYIYSDDTVNLLKSYAFLFTPIDSATYVYDEAGIESISINDTCDSAYIASDVFSAKYSVSDFNIPSTIESIIQRVSYPPSCNIGTTIVQQYGEPVCWAAVVASIGLELTGISKTAEFVAKSYLGNANWRDGGTPLDALLALQDIYDLDGVDMYYAPDFSAIKIETYSLGHPIYVRVRGGISNFAYELDHALFIDGYAEYTSGSYIGCLYLGDPNYSSYRTVYFSADGEYAYTLNGVTGNVDAYLKIY